MFHNRCSVVEDLIIVLLWLPVEPSYIVSLRLTQIPPYRLYGMHYPGEEMFK
jgi:hypothetical protein